MNHNEIYNLLIRYLDGEVTAEETVVMEELLKMDAYWKNEFEILNTINQTAPDLINANTDANWEVLKSQISANNSSRTVNYWLSLSKYATAAVIIFVAGWFLFKPTNTEFLSFDTGKTYKTGAKETQTVKLVDGSKIILNENSTLIVDDNFNKTNRLVILKGEAYFEVSKNAKKPFIAKSLNTYTKVLGTTFEIEARLPNSIEVSLYEGKVEFTTATIIGKTILIPGEKLACSLSNSSIEKTKVNTLTKDSWVTGLSFKDATLDEIIKKLESQYKITILIPTNRKNEQYTVSFEGQNLQSSIRLLEELTDSKIAKKDSDYILIP